MKSVLFVCMANRCRSPLLEAVLRHMAMARGVEVHVESCGIGYVSEGAPADGSSIAEAAKMGIVLETKAQMFQDYFLDAYDYIFAVNERVLELLKARAKPEERGKIFLATAFSEKGKNLPILDPYDFTNGFEVMKLQIVDCCEGILLDKNGVLP